MQTTQCSGGACSANSCSPQCSGGSCSGGSCSSSGDCSGEQNMLCDLMDATKGAKKCLMNDKIKARLDAKVGKKMDEVADLAVEIFLKKWEMMQECKDGKQTAEQKLQAIFNG